MCKLISFLSGKGGSGKTSLSLSYAKALSDLDLKVLLIDCDMSTHGATFFMRSNIEKYTKTNSGILTVDDILNSPDMPPFGFLNRYTDENNHSVSKNTFANLIEIEDNFYFMPSDISISNNNLPKKYFFSTFETFFNEEVKKYFDIIILDCQAGYCDFTRFVLRCSNIALLITEPDSVSAAANRALCFQVGIELEAVQSYQVFSKVTNDEALHYSKTSTSSFFTNLIPIVFDLELRKTFVYLNIPSAETVNVQFGKTILDTLSIILPEYKDLMDDEKRKLMHFSRINLESELDYLKHKERKYKKSKFFEMILNIFSIFLPVITVLLFNLDFDTIEKYIVLSTFGFVSIVVITLFLIYKKKHLLNLEKLNDEIFKIEKKMREIDY